MNWKSRGSSISSVKNLLQQINQLSDVEKLSLYLKLPVGKASPSCLKKPTINAGHARKELTFTITWLQTHFEEDIEASLPKDQVYDSYVTHCVRHEMKSLSKAEFGKLIKQQYPKVRARRLGARGISQYVFAGLNKKNLLQQPSMPPLPQQSFSIEKIELEFEEYKKRNFAEKIIMDWAEKNCNSKFKNLLDLSLYLIQNNLVEGYSVEELIHSDRDTEPNGMKGVDLKEKTNFKKRVEKPSRIKVQKRILKPKNNLGKKSVVPSSDYVSSTINNYKSQSEPSTYKRKYYSKFLDSLPQNGINYMATKDPEVFLNKNSNEEEEKSAQISMLRMYLERELPTSSETQQINKLNCLTEKKNPNYSSDYHSNAIISINNCPTVNNNYEMPNEKPLTPQIILKPRSIISNSTPCTPFEPNQMIFDFDSRNTCMASPLTRMRHKSSPTLKRKYKSAYRQKHLSGEEIYKKSCNSSGYASTSLSPQSAPISPMMEDSSIFLMSPSVMLGHQNPYNNNNMETYPLEKEDNFPNLEDNNLQRQLLPTFREIKEDIAGAEYLSFSSQFEQYNINIEFEQVMNISNPPSQCTSSLIEEFDALIIPYEMQSIQPTTCIDYSLGNEKINSSNLHLSES